MRKRLVKWTPEESNTYKMETFLKQKNVNFGKIQADNDNKDKNPIFLSFSPSNKKQLYLNSRFYYYCVVNWLVYF